MQTSKKVQSTEIKPSWFDILEQVMGKLLDSFAPVTYIHIHPPIVQETPLYDIKVSGEFNKVFTEQPLFHQ